jgi:hypothetical protein
VGARRVGQAAVVGDAVNGRGVGAALSAGAAPTGTAVNVVNRLVSSRGPRVVEGDRPLRVILHKSTTTTAAAAAISRRASEDKSVRAFEGGTEISLSRVECAPRGLGLMFPSSSPPA